MNQKEIDKHYQLACQYHQDQKVIYICLDNECNQKLLCEICGQEEKLHHELLDIDLFIESLKAGSTMIFTGTNVLAKQNLYNSQVKKIKNDILTFYDFQIENIVQNIHEKLKDELDNFYKEYIHTIKQKLDLILSSNTLQQCQYKNKLSQDILKSFQNHDYAEINNNLIRLHNGSLEISYSQEKLKITFQKIINEVQVGLDQSQQYFLQNLAECQDYLQSCQQQTNQQLQMQSQQKILQQFQQKKSFPQKYQNVNAQKQQQLQQQPDLQQHKPFNQQLQFLNNQRKTLSDFVEIKKEFNQRHKKQQSLDNLAHFVQNRQQDSRNALRAHQLFNFSTKVSPQKQNPMKMIFQISKTDKTENSQDDMKNDNIFINNTLNLSPKMNDSCQNNNKISNNEKQQQIQNNKNKKSLNNENTENQYNGKQNIPFNLLDSKFNFFTPKNLTNEMKTKLSKKFFNYIKIQGEPEKQNTKQDSIINQKHLNITLNEKK